MRHSPRLCLWNPTAYRTPSATARRSAFAAAASARTTSTPPLAARRAGRAAQRPDLPHPPLEAGQVVGHQLAKPGSEPVLGGRQVLLDRLPVDPPVAVQIPPVPVPQFPAHFAPRRVLQVA